MMEKDFLSWYPSKNLLETLEKGVKYVQSLQ